MPGLDCRLAPKKMISLTSLTVEVQNLGEIPMIGYSLIFILCLDRPIISIGFLCDIVSNVFAPNMILTDISINGKVSLK